MFGNQKEDSKHLPELKRLEHLEEQDRPSAVGSLIATLGLCILSNLMIPLRNVITKKIMKASDITDETDLNDCCASTNPVMVMEDSGSDNNRGGTGAGVDASKYQTCTQTHRGSGARTSRWSDGVGSGWTSSSSISTSISSSVSASASLPLSLSLQASPTSKTNSNITDVDYNKYSKSRGGGLWSCFSDLSHLSNTNNRPSNTNSNSNSGSSSNSSSNGNNNSSTRNCARFLASTTAFQSASLLSTGLLLICYITLILFGLCGIALTRMRNVGETGYGGVGASSTIIDTEPLLMSLSALESVSVESTTAPTAMVTTTDLSLWASVIPLPWGSESSVHLFTVLYLLLLSAVTHSLYSIASYYVLVCVQRPITHAVANVFKRIFTMFFAIIMTSFRNSNDTVGYGNSTAVSWKAWSDMEWEWEWEWVWHGVVIGHLDIWGLIIVSIGLVGYLLIPGG